MPLLGKAVLAVWNNVDPAQERAFNDWYLRQQDILALLPPKPPGR